MQRAQDADQTLGVDVALLRRQRLAGTQLLQHVVHAGQRQARVRGLLGLSVGVELFGEAADAVGERVAQAGVVRWERVGVKALALVVARVVANAEPAPRCERPLDVSRTR